VTAVQRQQSRIARESAAIGGIWRPRLWFCTLIASALPDFALVPIRTSLLRAGGVRIGRKASILGRVKLIGSGKIAGRLRIGDGAVIAPGVTFGLDAEISIGDGVSLSPGASLYTATHGIGFGSCRMSPSPAPKPITIENGVWVGMNSLILPGVTLGHGCVVSAGAVVTRDVEPDVLVAGNPAAVVQKLPFGDR
jgi:acetyltransferase-like isoleucine patch superfamily enzyme